MLFPFSVLQVWIVLVRVVSIILLRILNTCLSRADWTRRQEIAVFQGDLFQVLFCSVGVDGYSGLVDSCATS